MNKDFEFALPFQDSDCELVCLCRPTATTLALVLVVDKPFHVNISLLFSVYLFVGC